MKQIKWISTMNQHDPLVTLTVIVTSSSLRPETQLITFIQRDFIDPPAGKFSF